MEKKASRNYVKFAIKLLLTAVALYFVFRKIDVSTFYATLKKANFFYFFLALISFNLSKLVSAIRLSNFFKAIGLELEKFYNLKLYWVGMFYNLFLPGSIGGDGYKVYILNQSSPHVKLKNIIAATFLDRTSGMVFLVLIGFLLILFSSAPNLYPTIIPLIIGTIVTIIPIYYFVLKILFTNFLTVFPATTLQALLVQLGQVGSAYFLLLSLSIGQQQADYLALFMIGSAVSVLPVTIGGIGLRESVFLLWGVKFLHVDPAASVAFTLSFFIVTAITSFTGIMFLPAIDREKEKKFVPANEALVKEII